MTRQGKTKRRNSSWNKEKLTTNILGIFSNFPTKTLNYKQISKMLDIKDEQQRQLVVHVLGELTKSDQLVEVHTGKYQFKSRAGYEVGKIDMTQYGYGFLVAEELEEDVFIPAISCIPPSTAIR